MLDTAELIAPPAPPEKTTTHAEREFGPRVSRDKSLSTAGRTILTDLKEAFSKDPNITPAAKRAARITLGLRAGLMIATAAIGLGLGIAATDGGVAVPTEVPPAGTVPFDANPGGTLPIVEVPPAGTVPFNP